MSEPHKLLTRQLARSTSSSGAVDLVRLVASVSAAYEEIDLERLRTDRANNLMADELAALEREREQLLNKLQVQNTRFEAALDNMSQHDSLTDLPNRSLLLKRLRQALLRGSRGERCAVLYLDLDRFKVVNDSLGHPIGDALLLAVSARLRQHLRRHDTVARIGGDEFVIVLCGVGGQTQVADLAERLIRDISRPYPLEEHRVFIGVSIGICMAPGERGDPNQLIKEADIALYCAKEQGRGCYRFYEPAVGQFVAAKHSMETDLRKAVAENQFVLHFQPLVNLRPRRLNGFEALLRWNSPERGLVMPEDFMAAAEEAGLAEAIGEWVLCDACREAARWPNHLKLSINLSAAHFKIPNLLATISSALQESGLRAPQLEIGLTESVLMEGSENTLKTLQQVRRLGVSVSLDDFGTGYSSLSYLLRFSFDRIKIDQAFVRELGQRSDSMAIVRAVIGLCSSLGVRTTAEGVETEEQLVLLNAENCMEAQGFLFSDAQPAENIPLLLEMLDAPTNSGAPQAQTELPDTETSTVMARMAPYPQNKG